MNNRLLLALSLASMMPLMPAEEEPELPTMKPGQEFIVKIEMLGKRLGERRVIGTSRDGAFDQVVDESVIPEFIRDVFNALEGRRVGYFGAIMNDDGMTARILLHQPFTVDAPW